MNKETHKESCSRYYQEHKEERNAYGRRYYREHEGQREKRKESSKRRYQKNRERIKKVEKEYRGKHKEEIRIRRKKERDECRKAALKLVGEKCFFCKEGDIKRLLFHKKDGVRHSLTAMYLVLKDPGKWVTLCRFCHIGVHFCMKVFGESWEDIVRRLEDGRGRYLS